MKKRQRKKNKGSIKAKLTMFCVMVATIYLVNISGGWQKVLTRVSYDFDTSIVRVFK